MKKERLSIGHWRKLYKAVVEFKKLKCWEWMLDSDMFGVQNSANGEIGYCCVTGHLGEHFALIVYLGTEGLETYLSVQSGRAIQDALEAFASQKCLMASFEDRGALSREDREIIKKLELRFRGRKQWPLFRNYEPGYPPWYLNKDEVEYLTMALQQATEVSLRFKEDPDMLIPPRKKQYLVRVPRKSKGQWNWDDEWLEPKPLEESRVAVPPINDIRLYKIKKNIRRRGGSWEADFFFTPTPVREGSERPYYPYTILYVDSHSGLILNAGMMRPTEYLTEFPSSLMELIESIEVRPAEILVRKEEALELLKLIASRLNIELRLVDRLEMLERAQLSMLNFLQ